MKYAVLLTLMAALSGCTTFDRTHIPPGQRLQGPGVSLVAPTAQPWFAVHYGSGHRMHISQLNARDSFSIKVSLNKGPSTGMYATTAQYLTDFKRYQQKMLFQFDLAVDEHRESISDRYPGCIEFHMLGRDWRGRNNPGHANIEQYGLTCIHPGYQNAMVTIELQRRSELDADPVDMEVYAEWLFGSIQFDPPGR
jgi:hypothetical protein